MKKSRRRTTKSPSPKISGNSPHRGNISRDILPIPDAKHIGLTTYDARDPDTKYPPIEPLRPPTGAPNVLVVLIDDVGFGASSAFGVTGPHLRSQILCNSGCTKFLKSVM